MNQNIFRSALATITAAMAATLLLAVASVMGANAAATPTDQIATAPATVAIPPDADRATQALKNSPRHGEWVDITLAGGQGAGADKDKSSKLHTWVSYPERKDKAPVVIVIHEIFGMTDWVRAVADQLAAEGFIAIAPDLLSGKGPNGGGTEAFTGDSVRDAIGKLSDAELQQRLNATREYALTLPAAGQKTATIGFCWGGSASFKYAVMQPKLSAAVVYYGTPPSDKSNKPDKDALSKIQCPVLGLYGGQDARVTSTVEPTDKIMTELKKPYTHHVYEGAGHGFLRQQDGGAPTPAPGTATGSGPSANLKAAQQAWSETIGFLKKNLE